jgi:hypothetical protein
VAAFWAAVALASVVASFFVAGFPTWLVWSAAFVFVTSSFAAVMDSLLLRKKEEALRDAERDVQAQAGAEG